MAGDAGTSDFRAAWEAALADLELDVAAAESLLAAATEPADPAEAPSWRPPPVRGPLPSDLEPRARLLLERQLAVAHGLTRRLTETGRQRRLTDRIRGTAHVDIPVYVDLQA